MLLQNPIIELLEVLEFGGFWKKNKQINGLSLQGFYSELKELFTGWLAWSDNNPMDGKIGILPEPKKLILTNWDGQAV